MYEEYKKPIVRLSTNTNNNYRKKVNNHSQKFLYSVPKPRLPTLSHLPKPIVPVKKFKSINMVEFWDLPEEEEA